MTYYLAMCRDCVPLLPMPFPTAEKRDQWAWLHAEATHHTVEMRETDGPDRLVR